jgi:glycosyltransferase involved in cell wall biosynthesis
MNGSDQTSTGDTAPKGNVIVRPFSRNSGQARALRVALIGSYTPRSCGIATFTADVRQKLGQYFPEIQIDVYALDAKGSTLVYDRDVHVIRADQAGDYCRAARLINDSAADVVWVQHEFGIFGGSDGSHVCELIDRVAAPLITTFHTVLSTPSDGQRAIVDHILSRCTRVMVMSQHGRDLITGLYGARADIVEVIEHGAPERPFGTAEAAKARLGLAGRKVITTFGLLGPDKGIEQAIAALPAIVQHHPEVVYRILGETHPMLRAREGERYRESLVAQARALGVADHIAWENRFLGIDELLDQLEACDIYITPYLNLDQSTSGTLSYAVALGKAVVSTPYVHARELLADGVGCLIEARSPQAIAEAVNGLLDDPAALNTTQQRAYERGRRTTWPHFARASALLIRGAQTPTPRAVSPTALPGLSAVWAMSDATGMLQHAIGVIPDRRHGYCLDDNARALMLMNLASGLSASESLRWSTTYASFVQYAWNQDERRFRNFMRFERTWCEDVGSEDSNGRALWALGHTVEHSPVPGLREWAQDLFDEVIRAMDALASPRSLAFAALGAAAVLRSLPKAAGAQSSGRHDGARRIITHACQVLTALVERRRRPDWAWFEAVLGYDNPRLCQALIEGGLVLDNEAWIDAGLETLEWISQCQTSARRQFRPIGSESFGKSGEWKPFDQQPLEAQAAIEAAHSAWIATRDGHWVALAEQAYQWFFGANDRGVALADLATGRCRDGVTPRGRNENSGAESILAFQLSHYSLAALLRQARLDTAARAAPTRPAEEPDADTDAGTACRSL